MVVACVCGERGRGRGWQGGFIYASYREKGGSPKAFMCIEVGEGGPKSRTELPKLFIDDPSCYH